MYFYIICVEFDAILFLFIFCFNKISLHFIILFFSDSQPSTSCSTKDGSNKKQIKYRSIISDIFDGKLLSSVQCLTCDRISSKVETFQDLSLPIPSRDHLVVLHGRSTAPGATCSDAVIPAQDGWVAWILAWLKSWFYGPTVTLHDCLAAFFSTDELKGDNMYSCEKCNKLRNGIKFSKVFINFILNSCFDHYCQYPFIYRIFI